MRLLLDTHAFLWWISNDLRLSRRAREAVSEGDNEIFLSVASGWEIAIKAGLGRLSLPVNLEGFLEEQMELNAIAPLPVTMRHAVRVRDLPNHHSDPFDRLLVAQGQSEGLTILTKDRHVRRYDVKTMW